ncbi:MAG: hypothetical protein KAW17_01705 [Candidatus Eisenbacteria sp.]|nr:hypothetical protein [Candidatus Eisenbacteria bacterium]
MAIFGDDEDRRRYLAFIREETERFGVEVLSWCLMTNHVSWWRSSPVETSRKARPGGLRSGGTRNRCYVPRIRG